MHGRGAAGLVFLIALVAAEREAAAFCRTTTCPLPPNFSPTPAECQPADFVQFCASLDPPVKPLPIWWRNASISYDIQQNASRQMTYEQAKDSFATAFATWTSARCPGSTRGISIEAVNLGPVACDLVQYSSDQGNQHVIIFHDDVWPYNDANNTLGLTTITFDTTSGEIYDADMELNATVPLTVTGTLPPQGYDFLSIITHESGHFLGMAHSGDDLATMFAHYTPGTTSMRKLSTDDVTGICSIYPPDGSRTVDPSVDPTGKIVEGPADPTPRHGFQSDCAHPVSTSNGCTVSVRRPASSPGHVLLAVAAAAAAAARRARRRLRYPSGIGP